MHNLPAEQNPAHPEKEDGDSRAGEETCTTTLMRSRAKQTPDIVMKEEDTISFPEKKFQSDPA